MELLRTLGAGVTFPEAKMLLCNLCVCVWRGGERWSKRGVPYTPLCINPFSA